MSRPTTDWLLKEWGAWVSRTADWHNCMGENILHRAGLFSVRVQEGLVGHRILCADCHPRVRKVDVAVRRLGDTERDAVVLWYCLPPNQITEKSFTHQELAKMLGVSMEAFKQRVSRGRRKIAKML